MKAQTTPQERVYSLNKQVQGWLEFTYLSPSHEAVDMYDSRTQGNAMPCKLRVFLVPHRPSMPHAVMESLYRASTGIRL